MVFPVSWFPSEPVEAETSKNILTSQSTSGRRVSLRKSKPFRSFNIQCNARDLSEFEEIEAIWEEHHPDLTIQYSNSALDISNRFFYFDSPLREKAVGNDLISYAFVLKDSQAITYSAPGNNNLPFTPEWGHQVDSDKTILVSDSPSRSRKARPKSNRRRRFVLEFNDRDLFQFLTMENFWCYHFPGKVINLNVDLLAHDLHIDGEFKIVSSLKWIVTANNVSYQFEILEV